MPLSAELEELLKTISDEGDRNVLRGQLEKHPSLREGYLRQADYDRKMNAVKQERETEKATVAQAQETANKWSEWAKRNEPKHNQLMTDYEQSQKRIKELEEQVKTAAASHNNNGGNNGGEGTVDPNVLLAKVNEEIAKRGYVSAEDTKRIVTEEAKKLADGERKAFFEETLPNWSQYVFTLNDIAADHRAEFGEKFDRSAFIKFQNDNKIPDVQKAYETFVSAKRQEIWRENERKKIETEVRTKMNVPGTGAPPASELGPVQSLRAHKVPEAPADTRVGDGTMAAAAAAELRSEGKF